MAFFALIISLYFLEVIVSTYQLALNGLWGPDLFACTEMTVFGDILDIASSTKVILLNRPLIVCLM